MDDLDHCMHISDHDWLSFFEESEECCLLQPCPLACPDSSELSDAEDLDCPTKTYTEDDQQDEEDSVKHEDKLQKNARVESSDDVEDKVGQPLTKGDLKSKQKPELPATEVPFAGDLVVSSPGASAEKERWFVTVNTSPPTRHRPLVKKRKKQKKICQDHDMHTRFDLDIKKPVKNESLMASDNEINPCDQELSFECSQIEQITDLTNIHLGTSCKEDTLQKSAFGNTTLTTTENPNVDHSTLDPPLFDNVKSEEITSIKPVMDTDKPIDNLLAPNSNTVESDEFADDEFFSSCSYDSENYLSAAESMEEPQHLSIENTPPSLSENTNIDSLADSGPSDIPLKCSVAPTSCHKLANRQIHVVSSHIFQSAHHCADNVPNDNSTCVTGREPTELCMSLDTPTYAVNLSTPESTLERDNPGHLPSGEPDVAADSPEAYAKATGDSKPVYAISAFWDEMEKLTINDILHIRTGRCMLPIEKVSDELTGPTCDIAGPSHDMDSFDSGKSNAAIDTTDAVDSDYCTHLDKSKPDRSSCDFSTSDFEDEYWQFINSSRNSSPDYQDKSSQSQCTDYASSAGEEESDEMGTPVPTEDCTRQQWSQDNSNFSLCDLASPQQMRKNKSMYNIHALNSMEDLSLRSFLDRNSCNSLDDSLKMSDGLEVVACAPVMCHTDEHYQISFPKVFEYLFADNKAKYEAMSVSLYGLQEISTSPVYDYTLSTTESNLPLMCFNEEPIPIFSCSHPTVRELTFPKPGCIFLGTSSATIKDISPIRVMSQALIKSLDCKHTDRSYCFSKDLSSLFSVKKICFNDKGSDVWEYCEDDEEKAVSAMDSCFTVIGEEGSLTPKMFGDIALRQITMETNQTSTDYQSIFSKIKQSDMCLVCIAFASWVLRSSDPEAADTWKAALLANVSALSAIQYLRQYMKKKTTPQDDL